MKKVFIVLLTIIGCATEKPGSNYPDFDDNASQDDIYEDVLSIVHQYEFSIVFFNRADLSHSWYKVFAVVNNRWYKIEVRQNIVDSVDRREKPGYAIHRDITTTKPCSPEEANAFLSKLKGYHLFTLPEEDDILEECKPTGATDGGTIHVQLIDCCKVRSLTYYEPWSLAGRCPAVKELQDIIKIDKLFEEEW